MSNTKKLTFCALITALCVLGLAGGALRPRITLSLASLAGLFPAAAVIVCGWGWAAGASAAATATRLMSRHSVSSRDIILRAIPVRRFWKASPSGYWVMFKGFSCLFYSSGISRIMSLKGISMASHSSALWFFRMISAACCIAGTSARISWLA